MSYTPYYPAGWLSGEAGATPITPEALNHMDEGIASAANDSISSDRLPTIPITKGGTGATTAAAALSNLGGISITKLWQNASPTSEFAAQTISVGLSSYTHYMIVYQEHATAGLYKNTGFIPVGLKVQLTNFSGCIGCRSMSSATTTALAFNSGEYTASYNANWTTKNDQCVPYQIYGVKGVS